MTCIGLDRALVPLKLLRDPSISFMQASQVIGTANVVSNAGTVIVNVVKYPVVWCQCNASSCVIDVYLVPLALKCNAPSARNWRPPTEQRTSKSGTGQQPSRIVDAKHHSIELHKYQRTASPASTRSAADRPIEGLHFTRNPLEERTARL